MFPFTEPKADSSNPSDNPSQAGGSKWADMLSSPENRAALLQTGLSLMAGSGQGGNLFSEIGIAAGEGMGARDRVIAGQQKQEAEAADMQLQQQKLQQQKDLEAQQQAFQMKKLGLEQALSQRQLGQAMTIAQMQNSRMTAADAADQQYKTGTLDIMKKNAATEAAKLGTTGLTPAQQAVQDRADKTAWFQFLNNKLSNAMPGEPPPSIADIAAEFQTLGGTLPAAVATPGLPAGPAPTTPQPLLTQRKQIDGVWYVYQNGKWAKE